MAHNGSLSPGAPALRRLGLIGDPFVSPPSSDTPGTRLAVHAEALRFLGALDDAAGQERSIPLWVEKAEIPAYYHLAALAESLAALTESADLDMLAAYVPLDMMVVGRIRSALGAVAERLSNPTFGSTLAAWVLVSLRELDSSLAEAALLDEEAVSLLVGKLEAEPVETVARYFGECVPERDDGETTDQMMRIAGARQGRLEEEPVEDESAPEEDSSDPMGEAFLVAVGEAGEPSSEAEEVAEPETDELVAEGLPRAEDLVEYVIAYTKARLSPVIARGLRAYRAQGTAAMAQELKVTKAPKKTLAALARFACCRYRKVVLIYDRLDNWNVMPDDNKPAILGALSELRWALGDAGMLVFLVPTGEALELADQFASARRITWSFSTLMAMQEEPPKLDAEVVASWLDAASAGGSARHAAVEDSQVQKLLSESDGDVEKFSAMASAALGDAAARGLETVDEAAIKVAISNRD